MEKLILHLFHRLHTLHGFSEKKEQENAVKMFLLAKFGDGVFSEDDFIALCHELVNVRTYDVNTTRFLGITLSLFSDLVNTDRRVTISELEYRNLKQENARLSRLIENIEREHNAEKAKISREHVNKELTAVINQQIQRIYELEQEINKKK